MPRSAHRTLWRVATLVASTGLAGSLYAVGLIEQARAAAIPPTVTWTYPAAPVSRTFLDEFSATWTESGPLTTSRQSQWWSAPMEAGSCGTFEADGSPIAQPVAPAAFNDPFSIAIGPDGNLYVGDVANRKIRMITPGGAVSTFAGSGATGSADGPAGEASFWYPSDLAFDPDGNLYVADQYNHKIRKVTPEGVVSTFAGSGEESSTDGTGTAATFNNPTGLEFDADGNLYVSDGGGNKIRRITPDGVVTTFAGSGTQGATDATGTAASFYSPWGLAFDSDANLYVADVGNRKIRKITPAGVVSTFAGSGAAGSVDATGTAASFMSPEDLLVDGTGSLRVSDPTANRIRTITAAGVVTTLAGSGAAGSTDATGTAASFSQPRGVALDDNGTLFVVDHLNNKIRQVSPGAAVTTFVGTGDRGSADSSRAGSVSTDDGGVTLSFRRCYHLVVTVTDRDGNSSTETSPDVTIDKAAPTADVACTPDAGATKAALIACTATFSGSPALGSSFTADDVVVGGAATGWVADEPVGTGAGPYSFNLAGGTDGSLTLAISAGAIVDDDGYDTATSETVAWTIDRALPSTSGPTVAPRTAVALSGTSIPLSVIWSGADNSGGSGVARYELARSVNGEAWTIVSTALTTKSATVVVGSAGTVRYRVRAVDRADNAGAWAYSRTLTPRLTQQTSSSVKYSGTWNTRSSSLYSGGSAKYAKVAGRTAAYTITSRSIALVATTSPTRGKVKIYINGVYQGTVDLYRTSTLHRTVAWQKTWSTSAKRTIKLVVVGTKERPRVDLDAFVVVK